MSNGISGMVRGNIEFNHFHFLTLGERFYFGLFAWRSQHNFASCHWWSIMIIPIPSVTVLANKVVIKNIKLSSWAYNTQKFWFMLRSVCVESFISILHLYEKISGVRFCSFRDHFKKYFFPSVTRVLILNFELYLCIKVSWKLARM